MSVREEQGLRKPSGIHGNLPPHIDPPGCDVSTYAKELISLYFSEFCFVPVDISSNINLLMQS